MIEKKMDAATQLEIDEVILDYLMYSAIVALLRDYRALQSTQDATKARCSADSHLQMVNGKPLDDRDVNTL